MKELLEMLGLSDNAIEIYINCLGKKALTFKEIHSLKPDLSYLDFEKVISQLIDKKLLLNIGKSTNIVIDQYIAIPPFSAINNSITQLKTDLSSDIQGEIQKIIESVFEKENKVNLDAIYKDFTKIQEGIDKDSDTIRKEVQSLLDEMEKKEDPADFLDAFEEKLIKVIQSQFANILGLIIQLKYEDKNITKPEGLKESQWDSLKENLKNYLSKSIHEKSMEVVDVITKEINESKESLKEKITFAYKDQFEQKSVYLGILNLFNTELKKLHKAILLKKNNLANDLKALEKTISIKTLESIKSTNEAIGKKVDSIQKSIENLIANYVDKNDLSIDFIWPIKSKIQVKEEISHILKYSKSEVTIIVPSIDYIPLERLSLDYTNITVSNAKKKEPVKKTAELKTVSLEIKKDIQEKFDVLKKKVNELKGFELSHNIADLMNVISEVNHQSVVLESMKGWLNRLLVIRKHLDQNLRLMLFGDIENWEKDYLKAKEEKAGSPVKEEGVGTTADESIDDSSIKESSPVLLTVNIVSSESHKSKDSIAMHRADNINYRKIKNNNFIGILADDSYLLIAIPKNLEKDPLKQVIGFGTNNKGLLYIFSSLVSDKWKKAKPPKDDQITNSFNLIIENINDLKGKKISKLLQNVLDIAFKMEGISLNILEIKLLINRLKNINTPLDQASKKEVLEKVEFLNKEFSRLDLIMAPELRAAKPKPVPQEKTPEIPIAKDSTEEVDYDKINNLFEIFMEKIDVLKGKQISKQIQNVIDLSLKLQGYSKILEWKEELSDVEEVLEEQFKVQIKQDFAKWRQKILVPPQQVIPVSTSEEAYVSPGMSQSAPNMISKEEVNIDDHFFKIYQEINTLKGFEISKRLQDVMDIILETKGYSVALKEMKDWISNLRVIRTSIDENFKAKFLPVFNQWRKKYSESGGGDLDFSLGVSIEEPQEVVESSLEEMFDSVILHAPTLRGDELSSELQRISDILLESHGAVKITPIRQWISKLRAIKEPLEDVVKDELISEINNWKDKFR